MRKARRGAFLSVGKRPAVQAYVRPAKDYHIILRSIDLGAMEKITTYEELSDFRQVGSPFSIPKAALALAGFHPDFSAERFSSFFAYTPFASLVSAFTNEHRYIK